MSDRFVRVEQLLGTKQLSKLKKSKVAIFGLGAVGSFALESMVRSGIGEFILVDFDEVKESNFNRQLLALETDLGKPKVELAKARILEINPECKVVVYNDFACIDNLNKILDCNVDIVVDAIDSLNPKTELLAYCVEKNITIISSMGAAAKTDPFSIRIGDISETKNCALARRLRKRLKKRNISSGIECVYSEQLPLKSSVAVNKEKETFKRGRERNPIGTIAYMSGMFGLMVGYVVIQKILGEKI